MPKFYTHIWLPYSSSLGICNHLKWLTKNNTGSNLGIKAELAGQSCGEERAPHSTGRLRGSSSSLQRSVISASWEETTQGQERYHLRGLMGTIIWNQAQPGYKLSSFRALGGLPKRILPSWWDKIGPRLNVALFPIREI